MSDPYTDTQRCVERLLEQHAKHPRLIVALDFDDTVFDFHQKGFDFPRVISLIQRAQAAGFYIAIFTASANDRHPFIRDYLASIGIVPNTINRNVFPSPFGNDGKIFYNLLLDDRAGLGQACDTLEAVLNQLYPVT